MPAGDVFGLDGIFLNKSNPVAVSVVDINPASSSAGIAITDGSFSSGTVTLNLSNAAGLSATPFYIGAIIGVSSISKAGLALTGYNGTFVVTGFAGTTTVSYATTGYVGSVAASIGATTIGYVQLLTDGTVTNTTWSSAQTHGWFGAGWVPGVSSTVDRIDFSNDLITASTRGSLTLARELAPAATGNSNYGWFGGGTTPTLTLSTVNRIDFSNDSATASVRGPLIVERYASAATGNSNYGWFAGGTSFLAPSPPSSRTFVDRIDFSNDSATASIRGPLSLIRRQMGATGNSNYGWFAGGGNDSANDTTRVDRIDFSNDSPTASIRGPLNASRYGAAATGNSNYGWIGGGNSGTPLVIKSFVSRIDFSTDSAISLVRGSLGQARVSLSATGNSNYGWFAGGLPAPGVYVSRVERIDFSNDLITASLRGFLSQGRSGLGAASGQARSSSTRLAKTGSYGWFTGGTTFPAGASIPSALVRIDFSNDSATAVSRGLNTVARYAQAAAGNSNYGWFSGGLTIFPSSYTSIVNRLDFSNDNYTMSLRAPIVSNKSAHSAVSNSNYGWFGGGNPGPLGAVDRIDFSNDATTASPRGPLTTARAYLAATGNSNYGWFGGGGGPVATVDRIDFSNDLATASIRGPLSVAKSSLAATGNSNYGWFGGGYSPAAPTTTGRSSVDRVTFSNDLVTATPRGPLITGSPGTAQFAYMCATSNTTR